MYLRLYILIFSALISVGIRESFAEVSKASSNTSKAAEDIYIDDADTEAEGSGNGAREVKDDLEASGSGFGPDDEDGDGLPENTEVAANPKSGEGSTHKTVGWDPPPEEKQPVDKYPGIDDGVNTIAPPDREKEGVFIMTPNHEDRATSFFAQPGILAAVIGGAVVGLLCAILVVMFIVYRMRKKDEGSYALDEPKRSPTSNSYSKNSNREFYA